MRSAALLVLASVLLGCPPDPVPQPGGSGPYSAAIGSDPDFSEPHARIQVRTWLSFGETSLQGAFADGPALRAHVETERIGNCRLMEHSPSSCPPDCSPGELCVSGECLAWPDRVDRGDMEWSWPDGEQTVSPDSLLGYYATGSASTAGEVTLTGDGLALQASIIEPADATGSWEQALANRGDADGVLRWSNPVLDARVRLHMTDCVGSHGGLSAAEIECEGPDTGELVIPDSFLTLLEAGDWSHGECGSHTFDRYHAAAPEGDTTVRFETIGPSGFFYFPGQ